jgi:hypothetical protein
MSCAKVIPLLLKTHTTASFCFAASRTVDVRNNTIEDYGQTQRFRLYQHMIPLKFGSVTFEHFTNSTITGDPRSFEHRSKEMAPRFRRNPFADPYLGADFIHPIDDRAGKIVIQFQLTMR